MVQTNPRRLLNYELATGVPACEAELDCICAKCSFESFCLRNLDLVSLSVVRQERGQQRLCFRRNVDCFVGHRV